MLSMRSNLSRSNPPRNRGRHFRGRPAVNAVRTGTSTRDTHKSAQDQCTDITHSINHTPNANHTSGASHPLVRSRENAHLYAYESSVRQAFDAIIPTLKRIAATQHDVDFEIKAQHIAQQHLGFALPETLLVNAWASQLDMRSLFAWAIFQTYRRFCDEVFTRDPLGNNGDEEFSAFLQQCGFHKLDISPCADGRLAHVIRYVLRLPYKSVRRRSYAGAMFDIENSMEKWVRTELLRLREGRPNTADESTRYLKAVIYHHSSVDPDHAGCAAHGSDTAKAMTGGRERLQSLRQAVENTYCCGASIDMLLIGMDTDTDSIRIHIPDTEGNADPENTIDSQQVYEATLHMDAAEAEQSIASLVADRGGQGGMARFITYLLLNNLSQLEYVRQYHDGQYSDTGHNEYFIGAGIGFEEVQLRNLTFFSYMHTVEEAAADLDVGIQIFTGLNISRDLPVPVVVRFDYHGNVPGARERAVAHCNRVASALHNRYSKLHSRGLLHTLQVVRDIHTAGRIEILDCSVKPTVATGGH